MKRTFLSHIIPVFVTGVILLASCTDDTSDVRLDPRLATTQSSNVTSESAVVIGFVVAEGDGFTEKGICYGTQPNPTTDNGKTVYTGDEKTAAFTVTVTGLNYATKYYARAYGINSNGTFYGEDQTFTTLPDIPVLSTSEITEITANSATGGGEVTDAKGGEITARGVVYGTEPGPTIGNSKTTDGTGTGEFTSNLTDLSDKTTYYVRAYATNAGGTGYGPEVTFTTLPMLTWHIPGDYVVASYPGSSLANWDPAKSPQIKSISPSTPSLLEGYVYMANASNQWKIVSQGGSNYGDGGSGHLDAAAGNIGSPAGYYKINVDTIAMTYTAVATTWGVIGTATPNGWDDETALTYDPVSATWKGVVHLTAAEFKFRANHSWDYNYGSTAGDETLNAGGDNIALDVEADYQIILDLSHPNEYTYQANRWGVIGSATAGGWDSDQNMTWDATNKVFTVTLNLVAGEFKFRANDAWTLDYGDTGPDGTLDQGGTNISIAEGGNYTITLDLENSTYSVVKN